MGSTNGDLGEGGGTHTPTTRRAARRIGDAAAQPTTTAFEIKVVGFTDAATWNQMARGAT
ncbi:hypothetical protein rosag_16280 [Roseisolibacter agri]|uniref:Uncharacterized protein n=1 Tax=Roseisolibacter agri TaxID=2014610 RepID=A0AA37Q1Z2_9BACT|nr:hypothetical protein rosag_16280 [Roseisolibacter agri]